MYEEESARLNEYAERLALLRGSLNVDDTKRKIAELENEMAAPGFWDDLETAHEKTQTLKQMKTGIEGPEQLQGELEEARDLVALVQEEEDKSLAGEVASIVDSLEKKVCRIELSSLFIDPRDGRDVLLSIHPGAGGTESCDWAEMLLRMILKYCERREFDVEIVEEQPGDEAGIKSASLKITGPFAYGNLKSESGVHRLIRISPFDANSRRHTSFAAVEVLSEIDEDIEIDVREEDLKIDVFRASGHGGQKVNKTSSAVRLTHLPTGIVTTCQLERSQHRNRAVALEFLKAKLYDIEMKKKEAELAAQREDQQEVAWGSQIRSYFLQPYQKIKDHRTGVETGDVNRVLDGDLDMFVESYLRWNLEQHRKN